MGPDSENTHVEHSPDTLNVVNCTLQSVLRHVLEFLDENDKFHIFLVCKKWNEVAKEVFDPSADDNQAIISACYKGSIDSVRTLLKDSR